MDKRDTLTSVAVITAGRFSNPDNTWYALTVSHAPTGAFACR